MDEFTRRTLLSTTAVVATAGCLDWNESGQSPEATPTSKPPAPPSPTETGTDGGITSGVNEFDPDHPIYVNNRQSETRSVQVTVRRRETGKTVFDEIISAPPDAEQQIYNLKEANPDGIEEFQICGTLQMDSSTPSRTQTVESGPRNGAEDTTPSPRDCATVKTSACYGSSHVTIQEDGNLAIIYSIC